MDEDGTQHLMGIRDGAIAVVLLSTRRTVKLLGGKRACAIEGSKGVPLDTHHLLQRFAALEGAQELREERTQILGRDRIEDFAHRGIARHALHTVDPRHIACGSLLVKGQQRGRLQREQGKGGHACIRQCNIGCARAMIGHVSTAGSQQAEQGIGGQRLAHGGSTYRHHTLRRATSEMVRMRGA